MKKMIILMLVLVLTLSIAAGCRRGSKAESIATDVSNAASEMMPDGNDGDATDGNGFIGGDNGTNDSTNGNSNPNPGTDRNTDVDNGSGIRSSGFLPIHH